MQARDVSARGARIRFVESEGWSKDSGTPLVLIHDGLASHETFLATMEHLSSSFRVVAPDLPGFGASEKPDPQRYPYGYDGFADSIADVVAALGLGRVHVCGHAMGGGVALALAARHPALVHKLVLVDALVYPASDHVLDRAGRIPLVGALLWSQLMGHALFRTYVEGSVYAGARAVPAGRVDGLFASFNAPAARQAAHATIVAKADTRSLVARLPRIAVPSLVVWGRDDLMAPVEHGRRLARALKARFEVLECGRCPPDEEPAAFAAIVASFLQSTPSCRAPDVPVPAARAVSFLPRNRSAAIGMGIVSALVLFAILGPLLSSHDPYASDFEHGLSPALLPRGPSGEFWLGTDRLFRDVLSRLAVAARISLVIGVASTLIATVIGGVVGIVAGWFEGRFLDTVLMRAVDVGLAFPFLLLVMALAAALDRTTPFTILITLGLTGWLGTARIVRAKTMQIRNLDYVTASRALGQSTFRIVLRHVLPNVSGPLVVVATLSVAQMILAESVLSFLGGGIAPPTPTWGHMLFEGQDYFTTTPWVALAPGLAIMASVLGFNLLGEGLRDALDPRKN